MEPYQWAPRNEFVNRAADLAALERWWSRPTRDALALLGRRRVGKSWLFRRFADGKPALVLVADRRLLATQMARFADQLEPLLGLRPALPDVRSLIELLYRLGREQRLLAVIDEFPYLLPEGPAHDEVLSEVQATMEVERDGSHTKLLLCGSVIGQMESLLASSSPLHGRLQPFDLWPMTFAESKPLMERSDSAEQRIVRYAVCGGMARYLAELGGGGDLRALVCERVLHPRGPLFNDPRVVLEQELRSPATYFSILEELSKSPARMEHLTGKLEIEGRRLSPYLETLRRMRLVDAFLPVGAPADARSRRLRVTDPFVRFWFRFVFPHQDSLQTGLRPDDLWDAAVEPFLADHVAPVFEDLCVRFARERFGASARSVGGWWGNALNRHRRAKRRLTEEVDVVGAHRSDLRLVGECKWTRGAMSSSVLEDLREFKLPAIAEEGRLRVPEDGPEVLLFCRSGFEPALEAIAAADARVTLVDLGTLVSGLETHG